MIINSKNKQVLQIVLLVVIAVLTLGIGYASISAINLIINGNATASVNQNNFIVHFTEAQNITGTTGVGGTSIIEDDDTKASFTVTGLTKVGDYAEAKYTVSNDSASIGAEITLELTNSNPEYFKVTETIADNKLQAGETTLATVKVEMIKTPIDNDVSTSITAKLTANPLENSEATGGEPKEEIKPGPPQYLYSLHNYGNPYINVNMDVSSVTRTFNNFAAAKAEFGHPAALALVIEDNKVKETYVAFEYNNKVYYLRGGVDERDLDSTPVYDANINTLKEAFGECGNSYCRNDQISFSVTSYGQIYVYSSGWFCSSDYQVVGTQYDFAGCWSN